ncbi:hypothetical protein MMC18_001366 [Xylographa bjoerkii]|nr:hypothetical protein [Xylographa bjoerkii]
MFHLSKDNDPIEEMKEAFASLYMSGDGADMVISCGNAKWNVHSALFCSRSEFFHKAIYSGFKESEARTVNLDEEDELMVQKMVQYFYKFDYEDGPRGPITPEANNTTEPAQSDTTLGTDSGATVSVDLDTKLMCNAKMYALADRLCIWSLENLAVKKFLADFVQVKTHDSYLLVKEKAQKLLEVVAFVYTSTPDQDRGMRNAVVKLATTRCYGHYPHRSLFHVLKKQKDFGPVVRLVPDFGLALLRTPKLSMRGVADAAQSSWTSNSELGSGSDLELDFSSDTNSHESDAY